MTPRAVLVGPPGAGKSTIGRRLAHALDLELFDTDTAIERESGRSIAQIFSDDGEPAFRTLEERVVRTALAQHTGIVSLGGGSILSSSTRAMLTQLTVVYLEISVAEGLRRTNSNTVRPLLAGPDPRASYQDLMRHRRPLYRSVATIRIRTDGRSPARVVSQLVSKIEQYESNSRNRAVGDPTVGTPSTPTTQGHRTSAPRDLSHPAARAIRRDRPPTSEPDNGIGNDRNEVSP